MIEKYKIAEHLIIREDDSAIFDSKNLCILNFNQTGFDLISFVANNSATMEEYRNFANEQDISNEDFEFFFSKCLEHGIIQKCE